jgi:hypothetical protein
VVGLGRRKGPQLVMPRITPRDERICWPAVRAILGSNVSELLGRGLGRNLGDSILSDLGQVARPDLE